MKEYIDNLNKILQYKEDIKQSIISKGQTVGDSLCEYSFAIDNIITPPVIPDILDTDPLTFVRLDNDGDGWISIEQHGNVPTKNFSYRLNDVNEWLIYQIGTRVTLNQGDKIQFRSYDNSPMGTSGLNNYRNFTTMGVYKCGGNLASIVNDDLGELEDNCFVYLFNNCNITTAPILPWTKLSFSCYNNMFLNCKLLRIAPELPATKLVTSCYSSMFNGCSSLETAPKLPATTLAASCYYKMFSDCDKLSQAMFELPAIELEENCYSNMFYNCTSLQIAPHLPAEYIKNGCYDYMFYGCSSLNHVPSQARYIKSGDTYVEITNEIGKRWLDNVSTNGIFFKNPELSMFIIERGRDTIPTGWNVGNWIIYKNYFFLDALSDNVEITFTNIKYVENFEYAVNKEYDFSKFNFGSTPLVLKKGDRVYLRGKMLTGSKRFNIVGDVKCGGNIASLVDPNNMENPVLCYNCFNGLFRNCKGLQNAPELPFTHLGDACYRDMFRGCTSLTTAPELPATTLTDSCYLNMFTDCTSLVNAPKLPAITLANYCYRDMFSGCTSLTTAPKLPAIKLTYYCYGSMFQGCKSLVNAPGLPATTLADYCYSAMFYGCTSLVNVPKLPATTLANYCYQYMFQGCTSLVNAPKLPATTLADFCYSNMFNGCSSLVNVPTTLPATTLTQFCYDSMFQYCTSLVNAPKLPATNLALFCYNSMFYNCDKINEIYCNAKYDYGTTEITTTIAYSWLYGVQNTPDCIFHKNPEWNGPTERGGDIIPTEWTIVDWIQ